MAYPIFAARERTASSLPGPFFNEDSDRLRKTCLLMVNLLRRRKLKINEQILKELAQKMGDDVGEVSNMLNAIRIGVPLANAFGGAKGQWEVKTLVGEKIELKLSKAQRKRERKKLEKIRNVSQKPEAITKGRRPITRSCTIAVRQAKDHMQRAWSVKRTPLFAKFDPQGDVMVAAVAAGDGDVEMGEGVTNEHHMQYTENANLAPLGAPKFVPLVNNGASDGRGVHENTHEQTHTFVPDRHMNPERLRLLLRPDASKQSDEVTSDRDILPSVDTPIPIKESSRQPPADKYLLDEIEADLARTRIMFGLDATNVP